MKAWILARNAGAGDFANVNAYVEALGVHGAVQGVGPSTRRDSIISAR